MTNSIDKQSFGRAGAVYKTDGESATGEFCALLCLTNTLFSSVTWPDLTGTFPSNTIPAGTVIYGSITAFSVATGDVIAYNQA